MNSDKCNERQSARFALQPPSIPSKRSLLGNSVFNHRNNTSEAVPCDSTRRFLLWSQVTYFLQEAWTSKLHEIIETNLRNVGKGWFNIYEFNKETYEYGKVKRMLILTRLLMREALR